MSDLFPFHVVGVLPESVDSLCLFPDALSDLLDLLSIVPLKQHPSPLGTVMLAQAHVVLGLEQWQQKERKIY